MSPPTEHYTRRLALRLKRNNYHHPSSRSRNKARRITARRRPGSDDDGLSPEELGLLEKQREQLMRIQAEFENFRRRSRRDAEQIGIMATTAVLTNLLPVVDNFTRALQTEATSLEGFVEGVRMIHTQFMNLLVDSGLEVIEAEGQKFDPNLHEAVTVDSSGDHPDDRIVEVLQEGYKFKGRLIRPAMVKVARGDG